MPRPFALQTQRLANVLGKALQFGGIFIGQGKFPHGVNFAGRLRQRIDLSEYRTLLDGERLRPAGGADNVPGRLLVQHGVIDVHQAVNIMLLQHFRQAQGFIYRHRVGFKHLFCMIIIQISAIAANCRCIQRQRLIKRMDSDVMSAGDDDDLISRVFGASQRIERGGEDGLFAG